jgi:hypothetical protein
MSRSCVCGGSNENCRYCNGLGTINDGLADALTAHATHGYLPKGGRRVTPRRARQPLVPCPVPGCPVRLNKRSVPDHYKKAHSKPSPMLPATPKNAVLKRESPAESVQQLIPCPVIGCTAKLNPTRVERHLRRVHHRGVQASFADIRATLARTHLKVRNANQAIGSSTKYIVVKPVSHSTSKVSSYGQEPEKNLDATKGYAHAYRESGRFGSHPSHDGFDGESGPD